MRNAAIRTILVLSLCLLGSGVTARVGLVLDKTFTVPGLTSISLLRLKGSSVGGPLVALASDMHKLILFSSASDSTLFSAVADSNEFYLGIEYADVNRDSVPDISDLRVTDPNKVNFGDSTKSCIDVYDSAMLSRKQTLQLDAFPGIQLCASYTGGPVLRAFDLDGDGYNELIASTEKTASSGDYILWAAWTVGETFIFHRAPDSVQLTQPHYTTAVNELGKIGGVSAFVANRGYTFCSSGGGTDATRASGTLCSFGPQGVGITLAQNSGGSGQCISDDVELGCVGNISADDQHLDLLTVSSASWSNCYLYPQPPELSSASLELRSLVTGDSTVPLWSHDITGANYGNFLYHPQLPGTFFAFSGDTLLMFRGSDGSIRDRLTQVPAGDKHWDYPYADSIPRLIVVNGSTVSIYHLDIATGVADQNRNTSLPTEFTLSNPYPNPFNPTSYFSIGTGPGGALDVAIFNALGQRVVALYAGRAIPNSNLTFQLDLSRRASGVYFLRAQLNDLALVRKMLLLK